MLATTQKQISDEEWTEKKWKWVTMKIIKFSNEI